MLPDLCASKFLSAMHQAQAVVQAARKVYDAALASLGSLPGASEQHGASLALAYAEMELSRDAPDAAARALHVLGWFATALPYIAYRAPPKGV